MMQKQMLTLTRTNFIGTHATRKSPSSVSYANRPFITATSLLLHESRSWSLNQGKLTLRFQGPPLGGRSQRRTHTQNTEHTELTHQADCPAVVTMCHMGPPFCWLTGFRLQLTIPPFLYFFYSQGSKSSAAFIFGTNTKLNLHSAEFPWLVLKYRTPNCVIRIKGERTVPYLSENKPDGRVP